MRELRIASGKEEVDKASRGAGSGLMKLEGEELDCLEERGKEPYTKIKLKNSFS